MKKAMLIVLILVTALGGILWFAPISFKPLNNLVLHVLEKRFDADIEYGVISTRLLRSVKAKNVKIVGKDGLVIHVGKLDFSYSPISVIATGKLAVKAMLEDISIQGKASLATLLMDVLSMETTEELRFSNIHGTFFVGWLETLAQDLSGSTEGISFNADGVTRKDNSIDLRIRVLLDNNLCNTIPGEIRNIVFKKEGDSQSSMLIGITGNYKKPALRLFTKGFSFDMTAKN